MYLEHTSMLICQNKKHHIKIEGEFADIMCVVNPEHRKNVWMENGVKVLHLRLLKYLYGCMESALLLYDLYAKTLKPQGFVVNPYDRWISNITIDGKQCTIAWYVYDNKVLHIDKHVNTRIIEAIEGYFGELTVSRGKSNKFMGIDIELLGNGGLSMFMNDCIE